MEKTFDNFIMMRKRNKPENDFYEDKYKVVKEGITASVIDIKTSKVVYTFKPKRRVDSYNFFCINGTPYFVVNYFTNRDTEFERESINLITGVSYTNPHATVIFKHPLRNIGENIEFDSEWYCDNKKQIFTVNVGSNSNFEIGDWGVRSDSELE
jgi:hypothetical protein